MKAETRRIVLPSFCQTVSLISVLLSTEIDRVPMSGDRDQSSIISGWVTSEMQLPDNYLVQFLTSLLHA